MEIERSTIERLPLRGTFALEVERAEADGDAPRRIRGVANTFGVMRSGRIIHPAAVESWLKANPGATLPLLAQHGFVPGFATIGKAEKLRVVRSRGLLFEAEIASETEASEEAWTLIRQGMLAGVSIGWVGKQSRWVSKDDVDLDPWLAQRMKEAGADTALAFLALELVEISLVDVPDDRGGQLAARYAAELADARQRLAALEQRFAADAPEFDSAAPGTLPDEFDRFLADFADHFEADLRERHELFAEAFPRTAAHFEALRAKLGRFREALTAIDTDEAPAFWAAIDPATDAGRDFALRLLERYDELVEGAAASVYDADGEHQPDESMQRLAMVEKQFA